MRERLRLPVLPPIRDIQMLTYPTAAHALRAALVTLDAIQSGRVDPNDLIDVTSALGRQIARAQPAWFTQYEALRVAAGTLDDAEIALAQFVLQTLYSKPKVRRAA